MNQFKYRAFISYSHADEKWARWLHRSLETYRIPKHLIGQKTPMGSVPRKLAPVFRDREELASATDLGAKLTEALEGSACQIIICSKAGARSHWVNEEILAYKRLGRSDRIFSLIVDGEPYASDVPGQEEEECFPQALRFQMGADRELSSTPAEPIAADARQGKDGKTHAKVKLIAGILGVGFDDLRQRELQRRNRRLAIISSSAVAGMVFAIGLATTAIIARNEAELQRGRAEKEAETARRTASFMIDLFSVSDPDEARGRTITAREILTKGAERISTELGDQPLIQTSLMDTIGKVYTSLGLYTDARDMLEQTVALRRKLPDIDEAEFAQSAYNLGNVLTEKAEFDRAEQFYREALSSLPADQPENLPQILDLKAALAELHFRTGQYELATPLLKSVLEGRLDLFGTDDPKVADAVEELGLNLFDRGRYEEAAERLRESLALRRRILGEEPHTDVAENLNNLALILRSMGRLGEAETLYTQALHMLRLLYGDAHPEIAQVMANLAEVYSQHRDLQRAEAMYIEVLAMNRELLGKEHPNIAQVMHSIAFVYYDEGKLEEALDISRTALAMQRRLLGDRHPDVAGSLSLQGRLLTEAGELEEAESLLRSAVDIQLELMGPGHPALAVTRVDLGDVLLRAGALDEALQQVELGEAALSEALGPQHWRTANARRVHGSVLLAMGDHVGAEKLLVASYEQLSKDTTVNPDQLEKALQGVIKLYTEWGKVALAENYQTIMSRQFGTNP
jgi:tetratricopeptide (TPR) repeat protein